MVRGEVVIDNPQATSLALAATCIDPTHSSKSAGAGHEISERRIAGKLVLEFPVSVFVKIVRQVTRKRRRLDELHGIFPLLYANGV
jgi:hypothetical protein